MSPTTQNDQELSCALERVITMCRERITQAEQRRIGAQTIGDAYQARAERDDWELTLIRLEQARTIRRG